MNKIETLAPDTETLPVTQIIANFAVAPVDRDAAAEAADVARLSLLDWIAIAVAGRDEPVAKIVRDLVAGEGGPPEAAVIGHGADLPARADDRRHDHSQPLPDR